MTSIRSRLGLGPVRRAATGSAAPAATSRLAPSRTALSPAEASERFVAFTFAGAEMVVEADGDGIVTYAAGAFHSRFGSPAEAFVGRPIQDLVAPSDHDALEDALFLLLEASRLPPLLVRLSDVDRTPLALAGIALPSRDLPRRLSLTFARPPAPLGGVTKSAMSGCLARACMTRLQSGQSCDLGLIEIVAQQGATLTSLGGGVGQALASVAPEAVELAPGRFGLLGPAGMEAGLLSITAALERSLQAHDSAVSVASRSLTLGSTGLTAAQTAMALRQALTLFARQGGAGLDKAGFDGGLAGYLRRAGAQAADLRSLIESGDFSLAFQPIVSLADRTTHHYEALIRPKAKPGRAFSGPQDFVMMVEAVGLADELDLAVASLACRAAMQAGVQIAFNLSGQSVQSAAFRARLVALLEADEACKAGLVIVEITETAEIESVEEAALTADALRSLGVLFCLDDFGAGAADIRLMRKLLPRIVKLDGSYIPGVCSGGRERALVAGMVEIARAIGAEVVAERVETDAEANALRGLGVHYGQGWLFGRPALLPGSRSTRQARDSGGQ